LKSTSIVGPEGIIDIADPMGNIVNLGDITLHYTDWAVKGRDLVLVNGLASTSDIWDLVVPLLTKKFRV
jgi:hypothetical protein